jgi:hypothetical protein
LTKRGEEDGKGDRPTHVHVMQRPADEGTEQRLGDRDPHVLLFTSMGAARSLARYPCAAASVACGVKTSAWSMARMGGNYVKQSLFMASRI